MGNRTPRLWQPAVLILAYVALLQAQSRTKDRIFVDQYRPLRSELMIADADGKNARKLVPGSQIDYNASFSFDGQAVVFTSDRNGAADIFRVRVDGTGLERLTDSPAFDDQAALSPDNRSLAFVSTRDQGSTDIYILDLATRKARNLTNSAGGDFRPSWSPDGQTIAYASDRGNGFPHAAESWEHLQATNLYLIRADGTGLRKLATDADMTAGSPKWSADGKRIVFYQLGVKDTFAVRFGAATVASQIVSIDVADGTRTVHATGQGLKVSPQFLGPDRVAYLAKAGQNSILTLTTGEKSAAGDIANPAWSQDGKKVVYHAGQNATMHHYSRTLGDPMTSKDPRFELAFGGGGWPTATPDGKSILVSERSPSGDRTALVVWDVNGTNPRRIYVDDRQLMGVQWSPDGKWITFGAGRFPNVTAQRMQAKAEVMIVKADGTGARAVTKEAGHAAFPSWSPDGAEIVYRYWSDTGAGGLRIINVTTGATRTLTTEYDTLPQWSSKNLIVFSRYANDPRFRYKEFDIYTIRPDGSSLKKLTESEGDDAHSFWSPDGNYLLWSSARFGFKDEAAMTIATPQPYGELFVMNADGSDQRQLTDNQYEEGTPAWLPPVVLKRK